MIFNIFGKLVKKQKAQIYYAAQKYFEQAERTRRLEQTPRYKTKRAKQKRKREANRVRHGLCARCGLKPFDPLSNRLCTVCITKKRRWQIAYNARKRLKKRAY